MTRPGDFSPAAREAIMEASGHQCVGCGRTQPLNTQHRVARGMGGTSSTAVGHPSNGIILCGSGTTLCHGFAEGQPQAAEHLGWRTPRIALLQGWNSAPWWSRFGWRRWTEDLGVEWVDDQDVPDLAVRMTGLHLYVQWRDNGLVGA